MFIFRRMCKKSAMPFPLLPPDQRIPTFAVGAGRSGTHFWARLMAEDPLIRAMHLDDLGHLVGDGFLHYCAWYELPVDTDGFLQHRSELIDQAGQHGQVYFESNSYLSFHIVQLYREFRAKFIHVHRNPENIVNANFTKGWYKKVPARADSGLVPGYSYDCDPTKPYRYFGHIMPKDKDEYDRWQRLTPLGRIAWYWNTINKEIVEQLAQIPISNFISVRTETTDYEQYCQVHTFVNSSEPMSRHQFEEIRRSRPGKNRPYRNVNSWTEQERKEFLVETGEMRERLGYS